MPKIEEVMSAEQIAEVVKRVESVPPETFDGVADKLTGAADVLRAAAKEPDGRKRVDMLFDLNMKMVEMANDLARIGM